MAPFLFLAKLKQFLEPTHTALDEHTEKDDNDRFTHCQILLARRCGA